MYNYKSIRRALYLIESPMQLMSAIEAKHYFTPANNVLFIRYNGEEKNNLQIKGLLKYASFDKTYSVTIKEGCKAAYVKLLYVYAILLLSQTDILFVGNFKENFMKCVYKLFKKTKRIFLDDGAQSSYLYTKDKDANMFSYFIFEPSVNPLRLYVHNSFEFFRSQMKNDIKQVLNNIVYFIGAPLVEKNLINETQFHFYFSRIVKLYNDNGKTIRYISHRSENAYKLRRYGSVEVCRLDEPIELFLLQSSVVPSSVASFYSAALYSIQMMFHDYISDIVSYYLPTSEMHVRQEVKSNIEEVYKTLEGVIKVHRQYVNN